MRLSLIFVSIGLAAPLTFFQSVYCASRTSHSVRSVMSSSIGLQAHQIANLRETTSANSNLRKTASTSSNLHRNTPNLRKTTSTSTKRKKTSRSSSLKRTISVSTNLKGVTSKSSSASKIRTSRKSSMSLTTAVIAATPVQKVSWPNHKVIGYYSLSQAGVMSPDQVPWSLLTHAVLAFGTLDSTNQVSIPARYQSVASSFFSAASAYGVVPMLSVGGFSGSGHFSSMVSSNSSRYTFIKSIQSLISQYNLKGIDIDWEYPGHASSINKNFNAMTDVPNLLSLFQELRAAVGADIALSAAMPSSQPWSSDVSAFAKVLDWGNLMEYNFAMSKRPTTGALAPFQGARSAQTGINNWVNAGMPFHKICFGVPGYGRSWYLQNPNSPQTNGLVNQATGNIPQGDNGQTSNTGVWRWRQLIAQGVLVPKADATSTGPASDGVYVGGNQWQVRFDTGTKSSYAWNNSTGIFVSFEDPVSISYKREWARSQGMAGMMIWTINFDRDGGELLKWMN